MTIRHLSTTPAIKSIATVLGMTALILAAETVRAGEPTVLINSFEVEDGALEETIVFWEKARDFLKDQPGYISTRLHQSILPDARFQLVNVAQWESPETFKAAIGAMRESNLGGEMKAITSHASLYRPIRTDGE